MSNQPMKIAVLVSGNGSNLQVIIDAVQARKLPIKIIGVISNNDQAYALTRANNANIETVVLSHTSSGKKMSIATFEKHALAQLQAWNPDLVVLAGFMRVLSAQFIDSVPCSMINLHPSLLPAYKGLDTHRRVIETGDKVHGCSVHLVTAELDAGQVLTQASLNVRVQDTAESLAHRVQKLEHQLVPWTLQLIAQGVLPLTKIQAGEQMNFVALPYRLSIDVD